MEKEMDELCGTNYEEDKIIEALVRKTERK
jgi:hypothetical protein